MLLPLIETEIFSKNRNMTKSAHGGPEARIGWGVTPQKIFLKLLEEKDL